MENKFFEQSFRRITYQMVIEKKTYHKGDFFYCDPFTGLKNQNTECLAIQDHPQLGDIRDSPKLWDEKGGPKIAGHAIVITP